MIILAAVIVGILIMTLYFYVFIYFMFLSQEKVAFENCTGSNTITDAIESPQDNVCKEPVKKPRCAND